MVITCPSDRVAGMAQCVDVLRSTEGKTAVIGQTARRRDRTRAVSQRNIETLHMSLRAEGHGDAERCAVSNSTTHHECHGIWSRSSTKPQSVPCARLSGNVKYNRRMNRCFAMRSEERRVGKEC